MAAGVAGEARRVGQARRWRGMAGMARQGEWRCARQARQGRLAGGLARRGRHGPRAGRLGPAGLVNGRN